MNQQDVASSETDTHDPVSYAYAASDQVTLTDARLLELSNGFSASTRFLDALVASGVSTPVVQRTRDALGASFVEAVLRNRMSGETVRQG